MVKRLDIVFLAVIAVAALLQSSLAQTSYTVGDALGWAIPPNGPSDYSNWAAGKTFAVGNSLVFNFTGGHDVARVNKAAFDACNANSPISLKTNGPVTETLTETGEHYYICTFSSHCSFGQKLAINVSAATTSPAPQPSTPPPSTTPTAPTPAASAPQPSTPSPSPSRATPPSSTAPAPSPTATPPSSEASPPSPTATPPSPTATPPSPTGTTPSPTGTTPSPTGTTPSPTGTTPTGDASPPPSPPPNSATSLGFGGLSAGFLSIVVALFY